MKYLRITFLAAVLLAALSCTGCARKNEIMSGANCFIVNQYGPASFDARFKGNSQNEITGIESAEVLWESFGNDVKPSVGDVVSNVKVRKGIVSFVASGKDGNAVIAVKDFEGKILWSWHIWVCEGFDPLATAHVYYNDAGVVMDRNLGAISAQKGDVKALGLMYQWGRKDPFLSGKLLQCDGEMAESTINWPSPVASDQSNGTIDFAIQNPTTFITSNHLNLDWLYTGDKTGEHSRWNTEKTMYDPCPKGWKVPEGGENGLWCKALGSTTVLTDTAPWDETNRGMDFSGLFSDAAEVWYTTSGYRPNGNGIVSVVGGSGTCWSCTQREMGACDLIFYPDFVNPNYGGYHPAGRAVRCVQE